MITVFCTVGIIYFIISSYCHWVNIWNGEKSLDLHKESFVLQEESFKIYQNAYFVADTECHNLLFNKYCAKVLDDHDEIISDMKDLKHLQVKDEIKTLQEKLHGVSA